MGVFVNLKITDMEMQSKGMTSLSGTRWINQAEALKAKLDEDGTFTAGRLNQVIDALEAPTAAASIGADVPSVVNKNVQAILSAHDAGILDRYTIAQTDALVSGNTNDLVRSIAFNDQNGTFTITKHDGTVVTIDTVLEKVPVSMVFEKVGEVTRIKLTNQDGTTSFADVSSLVDNYTFHNTDTVALTVTGVGNQRTIDATVRDASLGLEKLNLAAVTTLQGYVSSAANSATTASNAASAVSGSTTAAQNYATNANNSATSATASATDATNSKNAAATSATDANASKNAAATSATNASASADTALAAAREVFISGQNDGTYTAVANNVTTFTLPIAYSTDDAVTLIRQNLTLVRGTDYTLSESGLVTLLTDALNTGDKVYCIINGTSYDANNLSNKTIFATPLDVVKVNDKVNDLSNILSTLNPNQSPTQTITGYDEILSLPKNAANGNASVGVKGMTAQNLVVNGDFSNGTTNWIGGSSTISVLTNVLSNTGNGTAATPQAYQNTLYPVAVGKKVFFKAAVRVTNSVCSKITLKVDGTTGGVNQTFDLNAPTQNVWYPISFVATQPSDVAGYLQLSIYHNYADAETANGKVMEVKEVMAIDLTALLLDTFTATQCETVWPTHFSGLQSTKSRGRVRSVSSDGKQSSAMYINGTEDLRRVPSAYDEIRKRSDGGYERVGRNAEYTLVAGDVFDIATSYTNVDVVRINKQADYVGYNNTNAISGNAILSVSKGYSAFSDSTDKIGFLVTMSTTRFGYVVAKGTYANLTAAQTALAGTKIIYQLATPVVTPVETSGTLLSCPSGSVYFEPVTADYGYYTTSMVITATAFPIATLESVSKFNIETGVETILDASTAVVAGNGLSFTHSGLASVDIVFFTYGFKQDTPEGNKTVQYYDSRYVVADTTNGKFYQWKIATTNGVPSITAVEV